MDGQDAQATHGQGRVWSRRVPIVDKIGRRAQGHGPDGGEIGGRAFVGLEGGSGKGPDHRRCGDAGWGGRVVRGGAGQDPVDDGQTEPRKGPADQAGRERS